MLYVSTAITHLLVLIFEGKKGFHETFKAMSYSVAPMVFWFVPIVGYAAVFYGIALQVMGIHKRQKLTIGKSVAVVLIPVGVFGLLYLIFVFALTIFSGFI